MKRGLLALVLLVIVTTGCSAAVNLSRDEQHPAFEIPAPVNELKDVAALYYKLWESYIKASGDGVVNVSDMQYLLGPAMLIIPAFTGASEVLGELSKMNDKDINDLILLGDGYELGIYSAKAKQVLKMLLVGMQTFFVLKD